MDTKTESTPNHDSPESASPPVSAAGTLRHTKLAACGWAALGMAGSYGGAYLAVLWTTPVVEASTDDFAGTLYLLTVPLGFLIGTFAAMAIAAKAEGSSPSAEDLFNRKELAFIGILLPVVVALVSTSIVVLIANWLG